MLTQDLSHPRAERLLSRALESKRLDLAALAIAALEYPTLDPADSEARLGFLASRVLAEPGRFAMLNIAANGQPVFAVYMRGDDGVHRAHAIQVLTSDGASITRIASFNDAGLFPIFALPGALAAAS